MPQISLQWILVLVLFVAFAALTQLSKVSKSSMRSGRARRHPPGWLTPTRMMWLSLILLVAAFAAALTIMLVGGA